MIVLVRARASGRSSRPSPPRLADARRPRHPGRGGGIFPLAFSIIRDEFPRDRGRRGRSALVSSLLGIGGGAGVVFAGVVTQNLSYHWLFWFPLVDDRRSRRRHHLLHPRVAGQDTGPHQLPRRRR